MPCYDNNGNIIEGADNAKSCGIVFGRWNPGVNLDQTALPPQLTPINTPTRQARVPGSGRGSVTPSNTGALGGRGPSQQQLQERSRTATPTTPFQSNVPDILSPAGTSKFTLSGVGPVNESGEFQESDKREPKEPTFLENIQNKEWWMESLSDIPGDNRLARIARGMAYISTPLSKRGANPQDILRKQLLERDTLRASQDKAFTDAQASLSKSQASNFYKNVSASEITETTLKQMFLPDSSGMFSGPDKEEAKVMAARKTAAFISARGVLIEEGKNPTFQEVIEYLQGK
jgi:hypothetical protein